VRIFNFSQNGVSNGLSGEGKSKFEELVKEDDELPHDSGERDLPEFAGGLNSWHPMND
jgi:hypothetical protein